MASRKAKLVKWRSADGGTGRSLARLWRRSRVWVHRREAPLIQAGLMPKRRL
jgi:hypothetical protein